MIIFAQPTVAKTTADQEESESKHIFAFECFFLLFQDYILAAYCQNEALSSVDFRNFTKHNSSSLISKLL